MELDGKDRRILDCLKQNSRLSTGKLAKLTNIPVTTVHNRLRKMQGSVIKQYTININYDALGKGLLAYILLTVSQPLSGNKLNQHKICEQLKKVDALIEEAAIITGNFDILVKLRAADMKELDMLIVKIRDIEGVDKTQTALALGIY